MATKREVLKLIEETYRKRLNELRADRDAEYKTLEENKKAARRGLVSAMNKARKALITVSRKDGFAFIPPEVSERYIEFVAKESDAKRNNGWCVVHPELADGRIPIDAEYREAIERVNKDYNTIKREIVLNGLDASVVAAVNRYTG